MKYLVMLEHADGLHWSSVHDSAESATEAMFDEVTEKTSTKRVFAAFVVPVYKHLDEDAIAEMNLPMGDQIINFD